MTTNMLLEEVWSFRVPYLGGGACIEVDVRREERGPGAHIRRFVDRGDSAEPQAISDSRPAGPKKTPQTQPIRQTYLCPIGYNKCPGVSEARGFVWRHRRAPRGFW